MTKTEWIAERRILRGIDPRPEFASPKLRQMCRDENRGTYQMSAREYARERMTNGLGRTVNGATAWSRKLERAGWVDMEREDGGFRRFRRF